jgi:hypothetical protein
VEINNNNIYWDKQSGTLLNEAQKPVFLLEQRGAKTMGLPGDVSWKSLLIS